MNIKNRLQKLEKSSLAANSGVYIVEVTIDGKYKFASNGKQLELTEAEFKKFENTRDNSVFIMRDRRKFIIDDISRLKYEAE